MSTTTRGNTRKRPAETRERIRQKALKQGQQRTEEVQEKVRAAMVEVERQIAQSDGIYPGNRGRLSINSIARDAGIHNTTLFTTKHESLLGEVRKWLEKVRAGAVTGRMRVRKEVTSRVAEWRKLYEGLAQSHRDTELALQQAQADLEQSSSEVDQLRLENARLKKMLAASGGQKVVPIRRTGKKG